MHVSIRLFAGLRERAGTARLEVDGVERVGDVWAKLGLGDEPAGLLYAVNRAYASPDDALADGDEVALIPPVSGGAFRISDAPLDLEAAIAEAASDDAGAVATFVGTVRRSSRGRDVLYLEYEAYEEMAEPMLEQLASELTAKHGLSKVAIHHRTGRVEIGDASVVIA
ncbi:MAG TPA: molybdenum cofactor biosynthesis protein MoaE, partial [Gaiellaceae bacterium]